MANEIEVLETFYKQPADVQDYDVNYTRYLRGLADTPRVVDPYEVDVPAGITLETASISGNTIKVWLSGGTAGQKYKVTTRMFTLGGRVKEAEIVIHVKEI